MTIRFASSRAGALAAKGSSAMRTAVAALTFACSLDALGFVVEEVSASRVESEIRLSFSASIELSQPVIDALQAGVPVMIVTEANIYQRRPYLPDDLIGIHESTAVIAYRSLYGDYTIQRGGSDAVRYYASLPKALQSLGEKIKLKLDLTEESLLTPEPYRGRIRVYLKRSSLPSVMQLPAYFDDAWNLNTGWQLFDVL